MAFRAFRPAFAFALAAAVALALALGVPPALAANPLAGAQLYVIPHSSAARYLAGHADPLIARIAAQPAAVWFDAASNRQDIVSYLRGAGSAQLPVLVAYNIPGRDCGSYSSGGARSAAAYRSWIRMLAGTIGSQRAAVVLEPDALAEVSCLPHGSLALLRGAVHAFAPHPKTTLYVDAGNASWLGARTIATRLRAIGAQHFALNVSNFDSTAASAAYGRRIVAALGGRASFVIDTSRNGRGAAPGDPWCNPSGRALGGNPTTNSGLPSVDALLWIKAPGESDGSCNGGPPAGAWWPQYARGLTIAALSA